MSDIAITIPMHVAWEDYQMELDRAADGETMNFKVSGMPKASPGDRCYVVHRGYVRGYMIISGLSEEGFTCTTFGHRYDGKFIQRTGPFYPVEPIPMRGFQGFRYVNF